MILHSGLLLEPPCICNLIAEKLITPERLGLSSAVRFSLRLESATRANLSFRNKSHNGDTLSWGLSTIITKIGSLQIVVIANVYRWNSNVFISLATSWLHVQGSVCSNFRIHL